MSVSVTMGKKKSGEDLKLGAVKIELPIITKARMIATDRGVPLATYLSDVLRASVEKDWAQMVRKASQKGTD